MVKLLIELIFLISKIPIVSAIKRRILMIILIISPSLLALWWFLLTSQKSKKCWAVAIPKSYHGGRMLARSQSNTIAPLLHLNLPFKRGFQIWNGMVLSIQSPVHWQFGNPPYDSSVSITQHRINWKPSTTLRITNRNGQNHSSEKKQKPERNSKIAAMDLHKINVSEDSRKTPGNSEKPTGNSSSHS